MRTAALAEMLEVTKETIRRDLDRLETEGKLTRTHGGALSLEVPSSELSFTARDHLNVEEKRAIAREAVGLIRGGDSILLDASSSALQLSRHLPAIPLTVITNALEVVAELQGRDHITVLLTGGRLDSRSLSTVGPLADIGIRQYHVNKMFFSCRGIDPERGLSEASDEHARLKRVMLELADTTILLADHTKFGLRSTFYFAEMSEVDILVTDSAVDSSILSTCRERGPEIIVAEASGNS